MLFQPLGQHGRGHSVVVVQKRVVLSRHGQLGLEQHRVEWRKWRRRSSRPREARQPSCLSRTEDMSKILLVQVGPEQSGVRIGGFLYGRTSGYLGIGTRVVVGGVRWRGCSVAGDW